MAEPTTTAALDNRVEDFTGVTISLASPEDIRSWSYGEVKKPETINYRTYRAEKDGLFCERIFGPERDWECFCGKYKGMKHKGIICDRCGVKVTHSRERRKRMGHINLAAPIVHIWFFKAMPSRLGNLLAMKTTSLEKLIYFQEYVVIDPGPAAAEGVRERDLLTEDKYRRLTETYPEGSGFQAGMGAEAVRELVKRLDLPTVATELRQELLETGSKQRKAEIVKRLKLVEAIKDSGNKPEWMIMQVIPVIPPDLRPLVLLESGNFATSDLNDLYRRVINRNNRLKKLQDLHAPEVIIRNEKRMLQQAVDALFDNDRTKRPVLGSSNRPLKSLTDMIKGKQGRFRENLLGKRVDYSARSVIVVGPELKLHQCGLPKKIALELFQPFIIRRLKELGYVDTIKSAKKMLERKDEEVWDILDEVIHEHPVLLNRAPTLHRMGIQAFEPILVEGNAIKIHPLVCEAFNADFDGDQMAVHLPLSVEAQAEAAILMMSTNNIFSPADGEPIIRPTLDMVLGIYYLTMVDPEAAASDHPKAFSDTTEVLFALEEGRVFLHEPVEVRLPHDTVVVGEGDERALEPPYRLATTPGRVRFNEVAHVGARFYNLPVDKDAVNRIISDCHRLLGRADTIRLLDQIKELGFQEATLAGISISAEDLQMPPDKYDVIDTAQVEVERIQKNYTRGLITDSERHHQITETWTHASNRVADRVMEELRRPAPKYDPLERFLRKRAITAPYAELSAKDIASILGDKNRPPADALHEPSWRDNSQNPLGRAIAQAGWRVARVDRGPAILGARLKKDPAAQAKPLPSTSDYKPLETFLRKQDGDQADLPVESVEKALGGKRLPPSARRHEQYWRDTVHNPLGRAIAGAGWRVVHVHREIVGARIERCSTLNPIWCMFESGARGSAMQIRQMAGMRGLMAKPSGEIMETPIKANFREGLPVLEYFSSTHGGRKGLADTALKTAESGYLTRKLADVAQQVVVTMHDCGTANGITKMAGEVGLARNIYGRVAGETVVDRRTKTTVVEEGHLIDAETARAIEALGYDSLKVRSVMTCEAPFGICAKCYGMDLSTQQRVEEGLAVGIIAAQSIGEPGTQLTMRTFHIGGVATTTVAEPADVRAEQRGTLHYDNLEIVKDPEGDLVVLNQNGALLLRDGDGHEVARYPMRIGAKLGVKDGTTVARGKVLANWDPHMTPIVAEKSGTVRFIDIEEGETMRVEIDSGGSQRSVIIEHKGDLHPQIMIEDRTGEILGVYSIPEKAYIEVRENESVKAGTRLARTPRQIGRTQDITAGLPRVTELFEARKPKDPAIISEISGVVHLGERKRGKRSILVRNEEADMEHEHLVPQGKRLLVTTGSRVSAGDPLVDGPLVPHDILRIKGEEDLQQYLLEQVQMVYRFCGEEINDKHMEVIIAQMLRKVQVGEDVGDTRLLPGAIVDKVHFRMENERVVAESAKPASATALLLGITKAALRSESFISAASFQETTKVLTEAALAGKRDDLVGLKENVILGHMIPAGTGFAKFRTAVVQQLELPESAGAAGGDTPVAAN